MALDVSAILTSSPAPIAGARHVSTLPETAADSASVPDARAEKPAPEVPSDLKTAVRNIQRISENFNQRLTFSLNEKLGQVIVKVIDNDTDKVVREIPPAELQRVYERIREVIGLLFDKSA